MKEVKKGSVAPLPSPGLTALSPRCSGVASNFKSIASDCDLNDTWNDTEYAHASQSVDLLPALIFTLNLFAIQSVFSSTF